MFPSPRSGRRAPRIPLKFMPLLLVRQIGNVTKDRLGPCQGSNERKVTGAGMGSGCGVQRRRRRLTVVCLPIRVQCRFGLETLGRKPVDANDMQHNQTSKSLL